MTRPQKILFTFLILTLINITGFSQISVSFYNSTLPKFGVAYNFNDKLWTELRVYSNTTFENITPELVINYNFLHKERFNVYAGIGGVINYFNGIVLPFGVQFTPFEKLERFSLHIECEPTFGDVNYILQSSWGLRYKFKYNRTSVI